MTDYDSSGETVVEPLLNDVSNDLDLTTTIYVVFDLETTGLSQTRDNIIEIAAQIIDPLGIPLPHATFSSLINPMHPLSPWTIVNTGLTDTDVITAPPFSIVAKDFLQFITNTVKEYMEDTETVVEHICLVAHNGYVFDVPFLLRKLFQSHYDHISRLIPKLYVLDTLILSREVIKSQGYTIPEDHKLGTLYFYCTGETMKKAHRAESDVKALCAVVLYNPFWLHREDYIYKVKSDGSMNKPTKKSITKIMQDNADDSDTDVSESEYVYEGKRVFDYDSDEEFDQDIEYDNDLNGTVVEENEEYEELFEIEPVVYGWHRNTVFPGIESNVLFQEKLRSHSSVRLNNDEPPSIGLQCSKNTVNSPLKAWRHIWTNSLLDKIVKYSNQYGQSKSVRFNPFSRKDLTDFFSILFIASIQKRKDKPSNWFSDDPLLECICMKRIMNGKEFQNILRFLHCCPLTAGVEPQSQEYDPAYKIQEIKDILEKHFDRSYTPGAALSLDETLIRAFGRIKFKVRIISKSARYGIKLYVLTDAETSFVLKVIIYTGKSTYTENNNKDLKKTVQVVRDLCESYTGSFRTVYIDRFYTSIDVMKELDKMKLFVTGTCMTNRVPKELQIANSSAEAKSMNRGDYTYHKYTYIDSENKVHDYGLTVWKDSKMVYLLSNTWNNNEATTCKRRSSNGLLTITRPVVVEKYNTYMGGVDVADQRRLHCNSTIMGQNRWWLKLFFYLLDVGTANALILYRLAIDDDKINLADFKSKVVQGLLGNKHEAIMRAPAQPEEEEENEHKPGAVRGRFRCAYCALYSTYSRTSFKCKATGCGIPLCCVGHGKAERDCFNIVHKNADLLKATKLKFEEMKKKYNKHLLHDDDE